MEDKEVVLSVRDLNVKFTLRGQILHAIRGISLDVYHGESLAIVGESGSGKSVFVKCAMGLLDANGYIDGGSILYNGMDLTKFQTDKDWLKIRGKEIAMVFQDPMTSLNHRQADSGGRGAASGLEGQGRLPGRSGGAERRGH